MSLSTLAAARYGKANVRVFRIVREGRWHHVVEYTVTCLLEGDIAASYTHADNSVVVATDSIKNITYCTSSRITLSERLQRATDIAKVSPHILSAERFALHLGSFFVSKYAHIHKAFVTVEQLRWTRIPVPGEQVAEEPHTHAFWRDGEEKRVVNAEVDASAGKDKLVGSVTSGLSGLLVLKSTGSAFEGFVVDEFTTLKPVDDRIFSTSVDLTYTFGRIPLASPSDSKKLEFDIPLKKGDEGFEGSVWDPEVGERARKATLETFAVDESASVQATLYKMGERVLSENAGIARVSYELPNKHYIPVDMSYIGVDNTTPALAEVFIPIAAPSGMISASIVRT